MTFSQAVLGCASGATAGACNPVEPGTPGSTTYNPSLRSGDITEYSYYRGFNPAELIQFDVTPPVRGAGVTAVTDEDLALIQVVPNPFIVFSQYQTTMNPNTALDNSRVVFTHVPPSGTIRIYTVSGEFAQQITWGPSDLNGNGDLFYDLRTREGTDLASGLYIWVLRTSVGGQENIARGKFVVIRGTGSR